METKVLEGIRVIDWGQFVQGPEACSLLGDLGADVVHVEQLNQGDQFRGISHTLGVPHVLPSGRNATFEYYNRNKRSLALDLRNPIGREVMHRLVKNCDVFVTNRTPEQSNKFGLDYATLCGINPRLVYGSASIFGHEGPEKDMPGFDMSVLARSGLLMAAGDATTKGPAWLPFGLVDQIAALNFGFAIMSALMARERFGFGQEVKSSALGSTIKLMSYNVMLQLLAGQSMPRLEMDELPPHSRFYQCQDGLWIQLSAFRDVDWGPLCRALCRPELERDPDFDSYDKRYRNAKLAGVLEQTFASRPRSEWLEMLRKARIPHGAVNRIADLESDPMVKENQYVVDYDHPAMGKVKFLGFPWSFSKTPAQMSRPAPEYAEHTEEVLIEMAGYTWADIEHLREQKVI